MEFFCFEKVYFGDTEFAVSCHMSLLAVKYFNCVNKHFIESNFCFPFEKIN